MYPECDACIQLDCVHAETKLSEQCLLRGSAAAAAPPIENMIKFCDEPTNQRTKKAVIGVGLQSLAEYYSVSKIITE